MRQDEQMKGTASYGMLGRSSSTHHCGRRVLRDRVRSHGKRNGQGKEAAFVVFGLISAIWYGRLRKIVSSLLVAYSL